MCSRSQRRGSTRKEQLMSLSRRPYGSSFPIKGLRISQRCNHLIAALGGREPFLFCQASWDQCWFKFSMLKAILLSYNCWRWQYHKSISVISVKYLDKRIPTRGCHFSLQGTHRRVFWGKALCSVTPCSLHLWPLLTTLTELHQIQNNFCPSLQLSSIVSPVAPSVNTPISIQVKHPSLICMSLGRDRWGIYIKIMGS